MGYWPCDKGEHKRYELIERLEQSKSAGDISRPDEEQGRWREEYG